MLPERRFDLLPIGFGSGTMNDFELSTNTVRI